MKSEGRTFTISIFVLIAMVYFLHLYPDGYDARILPQVLSILDHGTLSINDVVTTYPKDKFTDLSEYGGRIYPGIAPGVQFLSLPFYALFRFVFRLVTPPLFPGFPKGEESLVIMPVIFLLVSIPTLLTAYLLYRHAQQKELRREEAATIAVLYSVGTPALAFGLRYPISSCTMVSATTEYPISSPSSHSLRSPGPNSIESRDGSWPWDWRWGPFPFFGIREE